MPPLPQPMPRVSASSALQAAQQRCGNEAVQQAARNHNVSLLPSGAGAEGIIKSDLISIMPPGIQQNAEQRSASVASSLLPAPPNPSNETIECEARHTGGSLSAVGSLTSSSSDVGGAMWLGHLVPLVTLVDSEIGPCKVFLVRLTDGSRKQTEAASLNHQTRLILRSCRMCNLDDMAAQIDAEIFKAAVLHG